MTPVDDYPDALVGPALRILARANQPLGRIIRLWLPEQRDALNRLVAEGRVSIHPVPEQGNYFWVSAVSD